jgi:excisionase family DNA binding protein
MFFPKGDTSPVFDIKRLHHMPMTAAQAAQLIGVHSRSVSRAIKRGLLEGVKLGSNYLIWAKDLEAYALNHPRPSRVRAFRVS